MNIKKIILYILCGLIFLYGGEYLLKMIRHKHKENFELSTSSLSSSTSTSSLSTSSLTGANISTYAYLAPITESIDPPTDTSRITNDTLDAVIKIMKSQNTEIDAIKDTNNLSDQLKQFTTEKDGQYYIKNKQFPIDSFVLGYIKYATETDEYKTNLEKMKGSPMSKNIPNLLDPIQTPNRFMFVVLFVYFPWLFKIKKRITDNWQYPDTPSSPSEQLFSKDGYDINGSGTVFKCDNIGQNELFKFTNIGKTDEKKEHILDYSILPAEIPYFEFIDKEKPCNPCWLLGGPGNPPAPRCQFKIASSSPPLFQALWGIQPTSVESEKNTSTTSFSGFDSATATRSGTTEPTEPTEPTETKKENPAVTASDQNKQVAQNDADAKKAQLDVDSKKAEVDKQNADARKADAEATKAENEANRKPWF